MNEEVGYQTGTVSDVRLFRRALNDEEVAELGRGGEEG